MANVVETEFRLKGLDQYLKGVKDYNNAQTSLNKPAAQRQAKQTDSAARQALQTETKYKKDSLKFEREYSNQLLREEKTRNAARLRELKRTNQEAIREIERAKRERFRVESASRAGSSVGAIAGGALAGGAFGLFALTQAVQQTKEAESANRALSASATEAGKSYSVAAKEAVQFGQDAAISNTQAARSVGELQRLLTLAGQGGEFAKYSKGFLDVASARGVAFSELSTLFQGLISGTDDALNRFGKADPSKLAEDYAKSIGKTVEQLTEREKVMSRLVAFEKDFGLFSGANADRLQSTGGQADKAAKSLADIGTNLALATTQSMEFQLALEGVNAVLKSLAGFNPIDIRNKLQAGESPSQIAKEIAGSDSNQVIDALKVIQRIPAATGLYFYDLATKGKEEADNLLKFALNLELQRKQREDYIRPQIEAEQRVLDSQEVLRLGAFDTRNDQVVADARKREAEDAKKAVELAKERLEAETKLREELKRASDQINDSKTSLLQLQTNNPFVNIFADGRSAVETFNETFQNVSAQTRRNFANIQQQITNTKAAIQQFENANASRGFRNQARDLQGLRPNEINAFGRRFGNLNNVLDSAGSAAGFRNQAFADRAFAVNPFANDPTVLSQLNSFSSIATKFDALARQFGNLGIQGEAAVASAKLNALPSSQELVALAQGGNRYAQDALNTRAGLNQILAANEEQQITETLAKNSFLNKRIQERSAEAQAAIDSARRGSNVPLELRLENAINALDAIGTENLNAGQIRQKIDLLEARAELKDRQAQNADNFYTAMTAIIKDNGLQVDFGNQTPFQVEVKSGNLSLQTVSTPTRPTR